MKCTKISILALAIGAFLSASANADLIINDGSTNSSTYTTSNSPLLNNNINSAPVTSSAIVYPNANPLYITQIGTPVGSEALRGWANDIELMTALKQVVPTGWKAKKVGSVDMNRKVSWQGGKHWVEILSNIASTSGFTAKVDWNSKEVTIVGGSSSASTLTTSSSTTTGKNPFSANSSTKIGSPSLSSAISTTPVVSSYSQTWLLSKNKTLKENIQDWASKAGWTVSWDAPDYRIVADVTLTGSIDDSNGPIARIIAAYQTAEQPLIAKLSEGNKVIRIESRNYRQETVVGQSVQESFGSITER